MNKPVNQNRRLFNALVSFFVVTGLAWWIWTHPRLDSFLTSKAESIPLRFIDWVVITAIIVGMLWSITNAVCQKFKK